MTICIQCAAVVAHDQITGDEIPAIATASLSCAHPDARTDPVTGQDRGGGQSCRDINRGACPFFIALGTRFVRPAPPPKEIPSDSTPIHLRQPNAAQR